MTAEKKSRGGELLATIPESNREIAAELGVSPGLVSGWKTGSRRPTATDQARIAARWPRVPAVSWSEPPKRSGVRGGGAVSSPAEPSPTPKAATFEELDDDNIDESNTDRLRRFLRDGMRNLQHDSEMTPVQKAETIKKLADAQTALDRSTGANTITLARIMAHPEMQRCIGLIKGALACHSEALEAVTKAIESLSAPAPRDLGASAGARPLSLSASHPRLGSTGA